MDTGHRPEEAPDIENDEDVENREGSRASQVCFSHVWYILVHNFFPELFTNKAHTIFLFMFITFTSR